MKVRKTILVLPLLGVLIIFLLIRGYLNVNNTITKIARFYTITEDEAFYNEASSFSSQIFLSQEIQDPYVLINPLLLSNSKIVAIDSEVFYDETANTVYVSAVYKTITGVTYNSLDEWTLRGYKIMDKKCLYTIEKE